MSHLKISYDDYIVINDGQVTSVHLSKNVSFDENTLKFTLGAPVALHVILILSKDYELTYEFGAHTHAEIIETRALNGKATLTRTINAKEDANVQFFNENLSNAHQPLTFVDGGEISENAHVEMGYAELSDDSIEASYHYHLVGPEATMKLRMAILSKEEEKKHYTINLEHNAAHTTGIMDN
jgi:Fe-S cluster assembly protein SufD